MYFLFREMCFVDGDSNVLTSKNEHESTFRYVLGGVVRTLIQPHDGHVHFTYLYINNRIAIQYLIIFLVLCRFTPVLVLSVHTPPILSRAVYSRLYLYISVLFSLSPPPQHQDVAENPDSVQVLLYSFIVVGFVLMVFLRITIINISKILSPNTPIT